MENVQKARNNLYIRIYEYQNPFLLWLCILLQTQSDKFVQAQLFYYFLTLNYLLLFTPVFKVKKRRQASPYQGVLCITHTIFVNVSVHFLQTYSISSTGLFISVKEIINNESEIQDIFKSYFKSESINGSSYNKVKFDLESLIIDKSVEKKYNFYEDQELTILGVLKGFIIFNNDENFFVLDDDELELEVNEILSDLDNKGYV